MNIIDDFIFEEPELIVPYNGVIMRLSQRDHCLRQSGMYIGNTAETAFTCLMIQPNGTFMYEDIKYVPGLFKIIQEILDNSVDEFLRTNFKYASNIKITVNQKENRITIEDDGRGVPQTLTEDGLPMAVIAFTEARAGSNFGEEKANGIGTFGIGSYLTNVFSTEFTVVTADGQNELTLKCVNNAESFEYSIKKSKKRGTKVSFVPDLSRFETKGYIDDIYIRLLQNRCFHLAQTYPELKFTLEF